jgi:hypothetical protein
MFGFELFHTNGAVQGLDRIILFNYSYDESAMSAVRGPR